MLIFTSVFSNLAGLPNDGKFVQEIHQQYHQTICRNAWHHEIKNPKQNI